MNRIAPLILLGGVGLGCSDPGPVEIKLAHVAPPGALIALAADEFARRANERLEGRARVVVYGSAQLGDDRTALQKLKLETIDLSVPSTVMSSEVPALALFDMPYLIGDRSHVRAIRDPVFRSELVPRAREKGYSILGLWENGFRHVTNSRRPIHRPEDLAGIKIRTPNSPWRVALFRAFGANPSPLPFAEVFIALQTGVMDGQENPLTNIQNASFHQVQRYLSLTGHVYSPAYLVASTTRWSRLPEDVRDILEEIARELEDYVLQRGAEIDEEVLTALAATGIEINEVDREAFRAQSGSVYAQFGSEVPGGADWLRQAQALAPAER